MTTWLVGVLGTDDPAASNLPQPAQPADNLPIIIGRGIPATGFRCGDHKFSGIFADTQTGCKMFHFCESNGMNSTFFCPPQTLFNQRFFVCDWYYNVDCSASESFYSLNKDIYITPHNIFSPTYTLPEPVGQVNKDSLPSYSHIHQDTRQGKEAFEGANSELLPQYTTALGNERLSADTDYRQEQDTTVSSIIVSDELDVVSEGADDNTEADYATTTTTTVYTPPPTVTTTTTAASTTVYVTTSLPETTATTPPPTTIYNDAADPEPASYYDPGADPEPAGYGPSAVAATDYAVYDLSADPEPAGYGINNAVYDQGYYDPSYGSNYDAVADPEPAAATAYGSSDQSYITNSVSYNDYSADPEPYGYNSANTGYNSNNPGYVASSDSYNSNSYITDTDDGYYDPSNPDPEPASYYSDTAYAYSDAADPEPAGYTANYAAAVDDTASSTQLQQLYTSYSDAADPEPASYYAAAADVDPASYQSSAAYYDAVADPEPASYYSGATAAGQYVDNTVVQSAAAYYDAVADPEPASYYQQTIDLSASNSAVSPVSYPAAQTGYAAGQTEALSTYGDSYDDAADPEPDSTPVVTYDARSDGGEATSSFSLLNIGSAISNFYNGLTSNGIVEDSSEPQPDPEYTPYN